LKLSFKAIRREVAMTREVVKRFHREMDKLPRLG
jgi:hypothetical protein